jgi:hypothetical protein
MATVFIPLPPLRSNLLEKFSLPFITILLFFLKILYGNLLGLLRYPLLRKKRRRFK